MSKYSTKIHSDQWDSRVKRIKLDVNSMSLLDLWNEFKPCEQSKEEEAELAKLTQRFPLRVVQTKYGTRMLWSIVYVDFIHVIQDNAATEADTNYAWYSSRVAAPGTYKKHYEVARQQIIPGQWRYFWVFKEREIERKWLLALELANPGLQLVNRIETMKYNIEKKALVEEVLKHLPETFTAKLFKEYANTEHSNLTFNQEQFLSWSDRIHRSLQRRRDLSCKKEKNRIIYTKVQASLTK